MNLSDIPSRIAKLFAVNGSKNTIPVDSSSSTLSAGKATYDSGYPPLTMTAISAGGIPPSGQDMNGILYDITRKQQWRDAGGGFPFDSTFATAIGGYPSGAIIPSSDFSGFWQNTVNNNLVNPESAATGTGWVPQDFYGSSLVSISAANVTLSALQAARSEIILSGTLTGNRYLYLPAWVKSWRIVNNCTGAFKVVVSLASGSDTIDSMPGSTTDIRGNGSGIYLSQPVAFANPGIQKLSSGLILQFGDVSVLPDATITVSYKEPFPNGQLIGLASKGAAISGTDYSCGIDAGKSSALIKNGSNYASPTVSQGIRWFVIGY
ncbi:hypothetical protein [Klebsiella pneumoniae]|uniref:gp53-like domain-containing protein n=1 Tax=Klebsiella pneumoniae TaxID=573 RepID=UPI001CD16660|nr:hypothetical protein [Klebsiella pneumoniae]WPI69321.1 hypothetical protein R8536_18685 [Klebsiella pneumoniae]HBR1087326.1 hypothetical protein [Klebsiella pneumoniae]HBR5493415.1 hypothetical protein [Klebsiella pneumoniae]